MDLREVLRALKDGAKSFKDLRRLKKDLRRADRDASPLLTRRIVPVPGPRSRRRNLPISGLNPHGTGAIAVSTTEMKTGGVKGYGYAQSDDNYCVHLFVCLFIALFAQGALQHLNIVK